MMPGVTAQPLRRRFSGGGGGISNSWSLDFMTETYLLNGSPIALSAIIDKPERVGASGLEILDHDAAGAAQIISSLFTDFAALRWTNTVEWQELTTSGRTYLLGMFEDSNNDELLIERTSVEDVQAYGWGSDFRGVVNSGIGDQYGAGIHKAAVTYTDALIALSTDGSDAEISTLANVMNPLQVAFFGGRGEELSGNGTFIRKITLTAPVANSLLPSLSAA